MERPGRLWGRALEAHWHTSLLGMRLAGMLGCSGWPPRASLPWTRYAHVFTVVSSIARAFMVYTTMVGFWRKLSTISHSPGASAAINAFVYALYLLDYFTRNVGLTLTQMVMVRHSRDLCLLVRAMLLYLKACPSQRSPYATRNAILFCFGAAPFAYIVAMAIMTANSPKVTSPIQVAYAINDLVPVVFVSVTQDSYNHVVSASTDLMAGIADDVEELISTQAPVESPGARVNLNAPASTTSPGCPVCPVHHPPLRTSTSTLAWGVRALRVRYQCVQDGVLATNRIYALFNTVSVTTATIQVVVCLYAGMVVTGK
ncbi:uncharacterized protein LOC127749633 [Frankliniella occidentalis]|uniref:Uncharacterized protein LOC127749633 n=1 Tax=Frankliniella occidentalis TaxID=133901 RepID=A0A9C6U3I2_FRAOC|nr:uncharacterized protein LOC127749633 [Frankliniella occidentalis]